MDQTKVYGIQGEGRNLCLSCAERIYGNSLEMYMNSGVIQILGDQERPRYASKGLLCDECLNWIFAPEQTEDSWWLVDPDPVEHLRLLAPFADFLETLQVDALDLRNITTG
jgi:poly(3-hydroxyalkanoate) synthetase